MMTWKWWRKKLQKLINSIDDPIDNLKHFLWSKWKLKNGWVLRIRVPMKNKNYFGFEITITKEKRDEKKK